jgi:hypothetical protein
MKAVPEYTEKTQPEDVSVPPSIPGTQPEPLPELSAEERREWAKFTGRMPADWFPPETWPMLAQLCRHICTARWIGECLQEMRGMLCAKDLVTNDVVMERTARLQSMHDREGRAMLALMVRLRLTSQQRIPDADVADRARERAKTQPEPDALPWGGPKPTSAGSERRQ